LVAAWKVEFHDQFETEFDEWSEAVRLELLAQAELLAEFGPSLSRPHADTLAGSDYANMKELRFKAADGEWRVAFAFDPNRQAILLVGGDKSGGSTTRFYKSLIRRADERFKQHLASLKPEKKSR